MCVLSLRIVLIMNCISRNILIYYKLISDSVLICTLIKTMKIGIIGMPNVGKSTLFQVLTKKQVDTSNYPFATIDPNVGVVQVPDERLNQLASLSRSKKIVPAVIEFVDIAGLVKGAAEGEGLGNQFLSHIREVDAICHVVRAFESTGIAHVMDKPDPLRDIEIIKTELELKDLETTAKSNLASSLNIPNSISLDISQENDVSAMSEKERKELGIESQLPKLIKAAYELLGLITFFTTGEDETRAWTIPSGSTAKRAGRAIHSDFEEKFIRADVVFWEKLIEAGGWSKARELGRLSSQGKDYMVKDGDVIEFKI